MWDRIPPDVHCWCRCCRLLFETRRISLARAMSRRSSEGRANIAALSVVSGRTMVDHVRSRLFPCPSRDFWLRYEPDHVDETAAPGYHVAINLARLGDSE